VPGDGDTATVNHTVTVVANLTFGTSPSDQTTMVITIGSAGKLIVSDGITMTVRGNIYNNAGTSGNPAVGLQIGTGSTGGASLVMDSTQATTPTTDYVVKHGYYATLYARGVLSNRASMSSIVGGGQARITTELYERGACLDLDYVNVTLFGDASNTGITTAPTGTGNYCTQTLVKNTTFDQCGSLRMIAKDSTAIITIEDVIVQASTNASLALHVSGVSGSSSKLSMTRTIVNAGSTTFNPSAGWAVTNNYFNFVATGGTSASIDSFESFSDNFIKQPTSGYLIFDGSISDSYILKDHANANFGIFEWKNQAANRTISGNIFEHTDFTTGGDLIIPEGYSPYTFTVENNILLPNSNGGAPGKLVSHWWEYKTGTVVTDGTTSVVGSGTNWTSSNVKAGDAFQLSGGAWVTIATVVDTTHLTLDSAYDTGSGAYNIDRTLFTSITINHNTIHTVAQVETGIGVGENDLGYAGEITSLKSNLFWTNSSQTAGYKLVRQESTTKQDYVLATNADYNWGWNLGDGSDGNGYNSALSGNDMFSTGTPDAHGSTGDPQFVDSSRNLPTYDIEGLGNSAGTAWADATSYTIGDVVSAQTADYYSNTIINYRCITAHTSASGHATNGQPGVASSWRTNWEFMSLYRLREDTSRIATLIDWVAAGFTPTNAALRGTAHDDGDIGAVANSNTAPSITYTSPDTWNTGDTTITYSLTDADSDTNTLTVQYSTDNSTWSSATAGVGGDGTTGLATSSGGTSHTFVWDTATDLSTTEDSTVYIKITPSDGGGGLTAYTTDAFGIDNVNPTVSAGADQSKTAQFTQTATATDTGGINASTYQWAKVSGPGTITFGTATSLSTTISANTNGTYVISFTALDNAGNSNSDTFTLTWSTESSTTSGGGAPPLFDISISPGPNGSISPSWGLLFPYGTNQTFTITPNQGYQIADVLVDGVSIGPKPSYTFNSIGKPHSIVATFSKLGTEQEQQTTQTQDQQTTQTQEQTSSQKQATITQLKQQLISLITQVIQMLYQQIALMKG